MSVNTLPGLSGLPTFSQIFQFDSFLFVALFILFSMDSTYGYTRKLFGANEMLLMIIHGFLFYIVYRMLLAKEKTSPTYAMKGKKM